MENKIYYKYRSVDNSNRFEDIIKNKRLYASAYFDFDDTKEGHYNYTGINRNEVQREIDDLKQIFLKETMCLNLLVTLI